MPKNQKIQKIPIQWSQKLTLATFLLITFSKKKCPKFLSKKKIFDFFFENFFRKNLLIKKLPKPISKTSDLKFQKIVDF